MESNIKVIKTTNKYEAHLKTSLTYGESKQIQAPILNATSFSPTSGQASEISGAVIYETNKVAVNIVLKKLIDPQGQELSASIESLDNLPQEDGEEIFTAINEITSPKKKAN